jgi:hypothetical protein
MTNQTERMFQKKEELEGLTPGGKITHTMTEKLHIPSHRYETDKYDEGYERTFRGKDEQTNVGRTKKKD